jgi:hypothetical protein
LQITRSVAAIKELNEISRCYRITGDESFVIEANVVSIRHLEALIDKLSALGATSTSTVLSSPVQRREYRAPNRSRPSALGINYLQMDQLKFVLFGFRVEHRELVLAMCYLMTSKAESGAWQDSDVRSSRNIRRVSKPHGDPGLPAD